jgi:hypothetical protein
MTTFPLVIVRTIHAGVHAGRLVSREGDRAVLAHALRLWRWVPRQMSGALASLSECAAHGIDRADPRARTGVPVDIEVAGVIEVITVAPQHEGDFE